VNGEQFAFALNFCKVENCKCKLRIRKFFFNQSYNSKPLNAVKKTRPTTKKSRWQNHESDAGSGEQNAFSEGNMKHECVTFD
jgi:hypothetical protein